MNRELCQTKKGLQKMEKKKGDEKDEEGKNEDEGK